MLEKVKKISLVVGIFVGLLLILTFIFAAIYYGFGVAHIAYDNKDVKFADSLYFSAITLFTVGYGDIQPVDDTGRLIASIEGYFGIIYSILFSGFLINTLFNIKVEELEDIAKVPYNLPSDYKCYPKENDRVPIIKVTQNKFLVDFNNVESSWCSSVIHIVTKRNWTRLVKQNSSIYIKVFSEKIRKISIEIKDENRNRIDNLNLTLSEENDFILDKKLLEINNLLYRWRTVSEICFVASKDDVDKEGNFEIEKILITKPNHRFFA